MAKSSKSKKGSGKAFAIVVGLVVIVAAGAIALAFKSSEAADPQVHLAKAKEWIAKGDGNSALIELRTALQADPDHKASRLTLAKLYLSAGQGAPAQAEIDRLRGLGESEVVLEVLELRALLLQQQFQQLVGRLVTRPGIESSAELLRLLAAAQIGLGKEDAARRSYQDALGIDPTDARARIGLAELDFRKGDITQAAGHLAQLPEPATSFSAAQLLTARIALAQRRYKEAATAFSETLEATPNSLPALSGLVQAQLADGNIEGARKSAVVLAMHHPDTPERWLWEARLAKKDGKDAEVITALKALLRIAPEHTSSLIELGEALARVGEREQAVDALKRATRLAPDNRRAQLMLAAALVDSGNQADAVTALEAAGARVPDDPRFQALLGHLHLRGGDQALAIEALEKASAMNPEVGVVQAWLGGGYLRAGRIDSAVDALEKALQIDPSIRNSAMLALAYARDGQIAKGIAQAKTAVSRTPDDPLAHFLYGVLLAASKDAEGARKAFDEALRLEPAHLWTRLHLARAMFATGQRDLAITSLTELREQHPSALPLVVELGQMYLRQRQVNNAVTLLEPYVEGTRAMQPRLLLAQAYSFARRPNDAFRVLEQTDQMHPNNPIVTMAKARIEIVLRKWSDAERTLTPLMARRPVARSVVLALANVHLRLGKTTQAVAELETFLAEHPADLTAKLLLGQAKLALGDVAPARALVSELERAAPQAIAVLALSASVSLAERAFASALKTFRRASELAPGGRFIVGEAHALRGLNKPDEARLVLEKWLESHPEDIPVQRALGELALRANENDDAIERYDTILANHPNDVVALNNAAWLLLDRQPAKAREFAERAFNLRPEHPAVLDTYGWVLANTGNPQRAIRHLRKAVELMNGEPGHRYRLALAYSRADDRQLALQHLDEILAQKRTFSERDDATALRAELRSRR